MYQGIKLHASAGDKFALNDDQEGQEDLLTHMGRSLGAADMHEVTLTHAFKSSPKYDRTDLQASHTAANLHQVKRTHGITQAPLCDNERMPA